MENNLDEYAVVYGLNEEIGEWNHTVAYWNFGKYSQLDQAKALQKALDCFRDKTEKHYITRSRLEELATKFKDRLIEADEEFAKDYFPFEMEDYEMEFFGIATESKNE